MITVLFMYVPSPGSGMPQQMQQGQIPPQMQQQQYAQPPRQPYMEQQQYAQQTQPWTQPGYQPEPYNPNMEARGMLGG